MMRRVHEGPVGSARSCHTALVSNAHAVEFGQLAGADLVLDRIYRGGAVGGTGDDPLSKLLRVGNQGGFRPAGSPKKDSVKLAVLYTTGRNRTGPMLWIRTRAPSPTTVTTGNQARHWRTPWGTCC